MERITDHSLFRYGQRVKNALIINFQGYKALAKSNPSEVEKWKEEIVALLEKSDFILQGVFDKDNNTSNFHLHKKEKIVFVFNSNDSKLITLFKVDYGFGDTVNTVTMNALLKESDKLKNAKAKYLKKNSSTLEDKAYSINSLNDDIQALKLQVTTLENQKEILSKEMELYSNTTKAMTENILKTNRAICHSIGYRVNPEF